MLMLLAVLAGRVGAVQVSTTALEPIHGLPCLVQGWRLRLTSTTPTPPNLFQPRPSTPFGHMAVQWTCSIPLGNLECACIPTLFILKGMHGLLFSKRTRLRAICAPPHSFAAPLHPSVVIRRGVLSLSANCCQVTCLRASLCDCLRASPCLRPRSGKREWLQLCVDAAGCFGWQGRCGPGINHSP